MLNIAICDDSRAFTVPLTEQLKELAEETETEITVDVYKSYDHLAAAIKEKRFHCLILETFLRGVNGIELAKNLRRQGNDADIIFVSNTAEYALAAYSVFPTGYVLKNTAKKKMRIPFRRVLEKHTGKKQLLLAEPDGVRRTVYVDELLYIEVIGEELFLHYYNNTVKCHGNSLAEVYEKLPQKRFYRAHRSYVVNLDFVLKSEKYYFIMSNGDKVSVAKNRYAEAKRTMTDYLGGQNDENGT